MSIGLCTRECNEGLPTSVLSQINCYNRAANITNLFLGLSAACVVVSGVTWDPFAGTLGLISLWVRQKGASRCVEILAQNQNSKSKSLFGLNPSRTKDWKPVCMLWQKSFPPITQEELDAFPTPYDEYFSVPPILKKKAHVIQLDEFRAVWLGIHEKNRAYIRGFVVSEVKEEPETHRRQFLVRFFRTHLASSFPRVFFATPRTEEEMETFLNDASEGCALSRIQE